ncbi:MAG: superinfection exclusion B family protein [Succinivibrionaceae bacterium]|nr:superinfection exclusion B family protein [Succinivibrionaceae bacterium]
MEKSLNRFSRLAILNWIMVWFILLNGMIVMIPGDVMGNNVANWVSKHNIIWFTGLVIGISYFLSHAVIILGTYIFERISSRSHLEHMHNMVACLDFTEKAVLREFVLQRRSVINLPITEPAVKNLLRAGILTYAYGTPSSGDESIIKALMIALDARQYITYKVLGLSKNGMSEEQIEQILNERPKFAAKSLSRSLSRT